MQLFFYLCLRLIFLCLCVLPEWLLYSLARGFGVLLFDVFRLARGRALSNLKVCFPQMDARERVRLARKNYCYIAESAAELIKSAQWSEEKVRQRLTIENLHTIQAYLDQGQSVVLWMGHQTNVDMTALLSVYAPMIIAYSPIRQSRRVDAWVKRLRSRLGAGLMSSAQIKQQLLKNKPLGVAGGSASIIELIADHRAARKRGFGLNFFSAQCPFFKGPELIARRQGAPMFYLRAKRLGAGRYHYEFVALDAPANELGARTQQAVTLLQKDITLNPQWYLWVYNIFKFSDLGAADTVECQMRDESVG